MRLYSVCIIADVVNNENVKRLDSKYSGGSRKSVRGWRFAESPSGGSASVSSISYIFLWNNFLYKKNDEYVPTQ